MQVEGGSVNDITPHYDGNVLSHDLNYRWFMILSFIKYKKHKSIESIEFVYTDI